MLLIGTLILAIVKYREYQHAQEKHKLSEVIRERTEELVIQKERAEEVLANVLPKQTADELKTEGKAKSQRFKLVTVLFSDVQGFTKIAEEMNPEALIDELDKIFFYFDSIVERFNIEKIKTIGDAYMCAGGIPQKNRTNPIEVVLAALDMQRQMEKVFQESSVNHPVWGLRIGVHTGPVIAGVIGTKKYTYDIWGDTVNIASRMESSGAVGKVNITGYTHELIKEYFDCEYRGKMPVKYKGEIDMYFVNRLQPEYSEDPLGIKPNQKFKTKFQLIRLSDIEELIMNKMEKELPKNLYYHNLKHTVDVITQVELLGRAEGLSDEDMLLVKTAAIFHDTGFTIGYDDHELLGIKIAQDMLPRYDYTDGQVQTICELIYSTKHPPEPKNLLEEILCDADLDYLGRGDFIPVSQNLFRELFERNKVKTIEEWNRMQLKFIETHQYFTETARQLRNVNKANQLEKLKGML
ncbi:MAG: guanylate cyclase [Bacteroidetes bacterium GWF2_38_335]|nr:MAG: guanylate cyclase [Bacteroidetes bacterium GWF2_38_335]OFY79406.1 MAG: guanylate cyclase [Bacteroidetes bacterium RIFOXYA12_FULL_38_20]